MNPPDARIRWRGEQSEKAGLRCGRWRLDLPRAGCAASRHVTDWPGRLGWEEGWSPGDVDRIVERALPAIWAEATSTTIQVPGAVARVACVVHPVRAALIAVWAGRAAEDILLGAIARAESGDDRQSRQVVTSAEGVLLPHAVAQLPAHHRCEVVVVPDPVATHGSPAQAGEKAGRVDESGRLLYQLPRPDDVTCRAFGSV